MTDPVDIKQLRALIYPATRTVYKTSEIRGKTKARAAILEQLPALLDELEQLRAKDRFNHDTWVKEFGKSIKDAEALAVELERGEHGETSHDHQ